MPTEITKGGDVVCESFQLNIQRTIGISSRVTMMSLPNRTYGTINTFCTAKHQPSLAQKVMDAQGERIETTGLDKLALRNPEPWRRLKDYFTPDRLANNPLVQAEKEVLEANGYDLESDYYMAMDTPPGGRSVGKCFFLFATTDEQPIMDEKLAAIRAIFFR